MSNFPSSLTRNITSHSKENLAFHSLLRWKMILIRILTTLLMHFLFRRLGECTFFSLGVKGLIIHFLFIELVFERVFGEYTWLVSGKSPYAIFLDYRIPLLTAPSLSLKIHYPLLDAVTPVLKNCAEHYKAGRRASCVYTIKPDGKNKFEVFCDQENAGGGWTVFQKRLNGSVDFSRNWSDYKRGFGDLSGEFWLGLNKIHRLTNQTKSKLRVDLEDFDGKTAYAEYDTFVVAERRAEMYTLSVGGYQGTLSETQALGPVSLFPGVKWLEHK